MDIISLPNPVRRVTSGALEVSPVLLAPVVNFGTGMQDGFGREAFGYLPGMIREGLKK